MCSSDPAPAVVADVLEQQLTAPVGPDPRSLPTWETCAEQLAVVYDEVSARR